MLGEQLAGGVGAGDRLDPAVDEHGEARVVRDAVAGRRLPGLEPHRYRRQQLPRSGGQGPLLAQQRVLRIAASIQRSETSIACARSSAVAADGAGSKRPSHAITIVPRAGENVTLRRATFSAVEEAGRSARRRTISSSATRISISANAAPMQRRTPPPNGIHA